MALVLKATAVLAGVFVTLLAALTLLGMRLPVGHTASRSRRLAKPPAEIWGIVTDFGRQPSWRPSLTTIERIKSTDAPGGLGEVWRERFGRHALDLTTQEAAPPADGTPGRLVREIGGDDLPFRGRWVFEVAPAPGDPAATAFTLTEHGEVPNPLFRAVNRYLMGQASSIEAYLDDLSRRVGEPAAVR